MKSDAAAADQSRESHGHRRVKTGRGWGRRIGILVVTILAILLLVQLVASPLAKAVVNRKLEGMSGAYHGHVETVRVALWKAGIEVEGFVLKEREHENDPPPLSVKYVSTRFAWKPLLRGRLAGEVIVDATETTFIKRRRMELEEAANKAEQKVEEAKREVEPWREALRKTFPIEISRLEMKNGKARYIDQSHQPVVDVTMARISVTATGLRTRPDGESLPAKVKLTGEMTGGGRLQVDIEADPLARPPHFKSTTALQDLALPPLNPLLLAYADADVSRGTFDFYLEVTAEKGGYQGYTKPFFKDLDFKNASDAEKPLTKRIVETTANAVTSVLKNDEDEKVATKVPFSGTFENTEVDVWTAVGNLMRNAFVQALKEGFEGGGK